MINSLWRSGQFPRSLQNRSGLIVESRNARLEKHLSSEVLRNAVLASENEELKQNIERYAATQRTLIRDLERALEIKWYRKLLRR